MLLDGLCVVEVVFDELGNDCVWSSAQALKLLCFNYLILSTCRERTLSTTSILSPPFHEWWRLERTIEGLETRPSLLCKVLFELGVRAVQE